MVRFACVTCGKMISSPDEHAGRTGTCPSCGERLRIPFMQPDSHALPEPPRPWPAAPSSPPAPNLPRPVPAPSKNVPPPAIPMPVAANQPSSTPQSPITQPRQQSAITMAPQKDRGLAVFVTVFFLGFLGCCLWFDSVRHSPPSREIPCPVCHKTVVWDDYDWSTGCCRSCAYRATRMR
jgi:DNA-directed RNA polymerase subunit RPC12/RpoP